MISLKARHDHDGYAGDCWSLHKDGLLPIFDTVSGLPVDALLTQLLDTFFEYYGDIFCHLNRRYLDSLIERGEAPVFLICVMSALASRFCPAELFADFFPSTTDGPKKEAWEHSVPFLERTKALTMLALDLPSADVIGGLLMLAWADFGDNNEAGMALDVGAGIHLHIVSNLRLRIMDVHRNGSTYGNRIRTAP